MTQIQDSQATRNTQNQEHNGQVSEAEHMARLATAAESLLFVAGRPLEYTELRKLLDTDDTRLARVLDTLSEQLESQGRGIRVQRLGSQVQLVTAPENARYIAALLGLPMTAKLTTAAMETLAVISYRQPMTRAQIEAVRGVNSDRALVSLLQHGLVTEVGRAQTVGRPALFATTAEFLQQFGLTSLTELPHVEQATLESQNEPKVQEVEPEAVQPEIPGMEANAPVVPASEDSTPLAFPENPETVAVETFALEASTPLALAPDVPADEAQSAAETSDLEVNESGETSEMEAGAE